MNIFFDQKVTLDERCKNTKSHDTILDNNLAIIQESTEDIAEQETRQEASASNITPIPQKFADKFPNLPLDKQQKYYNKYLKVVRKCLLKRLPFMNNSETYVSLYKLMRNCGEFQYDNTRYYIWNEFKEACPFFYVLHTGNNITITKNPFEKNSKVKIMNHTQINKLIDSCQAEELVEMFYSDITNPDELTVVDVNMPSLNNFIAHCELELKKNHTQIYIDQVRKNYYQAKYVKIISNFFSQAYDRPVLPMIPQKSDYGRTYYKGINVMNMREEVRRAVLGDYYQYDLNAAVYAVKLMLAKAILREQGISDFGHFTATKDYLDFKSCLRETIAKRSLTHMNVTPDFKVSLVKEAINAIGFGARIGGGSWQVKDEWHTPAINDIIKNQKDREQFVKDPWVKEFIKEQQDMTKFIVDHYLSKPEFVKKIDNVKNMKNNNGRIRRIQVMAYLYQHTESLIMDEIEKLAKTKTIRIHDALITTKMIMNSDLLDIKELLSQLDKDLTIGFEYKKAWTHPGNDYENDESDIDEAFAKLIANLHK